MSVTIKGCLELDGTITFTEGLCFYTEACLVGSGVHKGQIEITISGECCTEDTYFACVDPISKQFTVVIPENCCEKPFGCSTCADFAGDCSDAHTWSEIEINLSGFSDCGCVTLSTLPDISEDISNNNLCSDLNGTHILTNNSCGSGEFWRPDSNICTWSGLLGGEVKLRKYATTDCSGDPTFVSCDRVDSRDFRLVASYVPSAGLTITALATQSDLPFNCVGIFRHLKVLAFDCWTYWETPRPNILGVCVGNNHPACGDSGQISISIPPTAIDLAYWPTGEAPC